jgi:two-component system, NtrC family, sensor histidine kinase KinB
MQEYRLAARLCQAPRVSVRRFAPERVDATRGSHGCAFHVIAVYYGDFAEDRSECSHAVLAVRGTGKPVCMTFSLRKKILLGYGIALILIAIVLAWSVVSLTRLGKAGDAILRKNYASILAADSMIGALEEQNTALLRFLLGHDKTAADLFHANEIVFLRWLGRARDNITEPGESETLLEIETAYTRFLDETEPVLLAGSASDARSLPYSPALAAAADSTRDGCLRLKDINQTAMYRSSALAQRLATHAVASMLFIGIAAIVLALVFSIGLANFISNPLRGFMRAARDIAGGNYDVRITAGSSDELGHLAFEFNIMAEKLKSFHDMNIGQLIAEKKKSEALVRSIDDGLIFVDSENRIGEINSPAAKIFGTTPQEASGKHLLEVVRNERLFGWVRQALESGNPVIPSDQEIITLSFGESRNHYQCSINPVSTEAGPTVGVLVVLRDVTRLKELDMLKSQFVLTASHELRTPLASALMEVELLSESAPAKLTEKEANLLAAARQDLTRLRVLVNDLLELSKIESGKIDIAFESVPVGVLVDGAVNLLKEQSEQRKIQLVSRLSDDLPPVKADPNKVVWVLTNLLSNALRYTDENGVIRVSAERFGSQVHISVSDNGIGIPYEYQSRIFDKFVQVKTGREGGGSGLGLAISKEIVRAHGGTIWVDSTPGEGTTFTFTLPVSGKEKTA